MPKEILQPVESLTKRVVNPGAEKWMYKKVDVLDHGFIYLVDYMGNDAALADAARVSYGLGTRSVSDNNGLIRYLDRHKHTSPFEMAELKFHVKLPISVARQWIRHRTASVNEVSARYSILPDEFYIPDADSINVQSKTNRQGRGEKVNADEAALVQRIFKEGAKRNYEDYLFLLNDDGKGNPVDPGRPQVARELARNVLPVDIYTEWYWKIDLHNLFHFMLLRMDSHAQWEIRQYANAIGEFINEAYPLSYKAFEDYELCATNFSKTEKEVLSSLLNGITFDETYIRLTAGEAGLTNKLEIEEMMEKFRNLGLIK